MTIKRALILLSALGFVVSVSAATTGAEAKTIKKMHHSKMMMKKPMKKKMM